MKKLLILVIMMLSSVAFAGSFQCLIFASKEIADGWITNLETTWTHQPGWKYGDPIPLKNGSWAVRITESAKQYMSSGDLASITQISDSEIAQEPAP